MPVNWKDPEAFTRLLAAMVAAQDMKVCSEFSLPHTISSSLFSSLDPVCCDSKVLSLCLYQRKFALCILIPQLFRRMLTYNFQLDYRKIASMYGNGMWQRFRHPLSFETYYLTSPAPLPPRLVLMINPQALPTTPSKAASASSSGRLQP